MSFFILVACYNQAHAHEMHRKTTVMLDENAAPTFVPKDEMIIDDLETLKVLADPMRLTILEYLMKPSTVKRIAEKIDKPATKLYYHFNLLEKHNLIQLVDTRIVSGIIEKHYQASAKSYRLARGLLTPGSDNTDEGLDVMFGGIVADARNDIAESIRSGLIRTDEDREIHDSLLLQSQRFKLTEAQSRAFYDRLLGLIREFSGDDITGANEANPDAKTYKLMIVLHPSSRNPDRA